MSDIWRENIKTCKRIVAENLGPRVVNVVSGSPADQAFWHERTHAARRDVYRLDGDTLILSSLEPMRKGNFLGSVNAWLEIKKALSGRTYPPMILMNMVFGQGKRRSPFTQALGNRKPAFPTPMRSINQSNYLTSADIASFTSSLWLNHLEADGFRGIIVKWGDEAILPGMIWSVDTDRYRDVDGVRFVWLTEPTEDLAREKEWVEFETQSRRMTFQYTRQELGSLRNRLAERGRDRSIGVNLGSLGISYRLMGAVEAVFQADMDDEQKWVDWDPYTWIALACRDESEWTAEAAREERLGRTGMRDLGRRIPDFFQKIQQVKETFRLRHGRLPIIGVLDFGEPFWMDWGLHLSLRRSLEAMTADTDWGVTLRELFGLPQARDGRGNILVRSNLSPGADVRDSLLVDTVITGNDTLIHGGLVLAGRHRSLHMPDGGCALFCAADEMTFNGPRAIAFKATGKELMLEGGERLAHLYLTDCRLEMRSNEALISYEEENYSLPVLGNSLSFEDASRRMALEDNRLVEKRWLESWSGLAG